MNKLGILIISILAVFLGGCMGIDTIPDLKKHGTGLNQERIASRILEEYFDRQQYLSDIAWPLLTKSTDLCKTKKRYHYGFRVTSNRLLPDEYKKSGKKYFGIGNLPMVTTIIKTGPAALAGLKKGDLITGINDIEIRDRKRAIRYLKKILENLGEKQERLNLKVNRNGTTIHVNNVRSVEQCEYAVQVVIKDEIESFTDGENIYVYKGLTDISQTEELQFMIAHGMAHNIKNHLTKRRIGALAAITVDIMIGMKFEEWDFIIIKHLIEVIMPEHEVAADSLGLRIMRNAGIDTEGIVVYWERLYSDYPNALNVTGINTHEVKKKRYKNIIQTQREIMSLKFYDN